LGYASISRVNFLATNGQLGSESFDCVACQLGKQSALPFNKSDYVFSAHFDLIPSDVWGPAPIPTMGGSRYCDICGWLFSIHMDLSFTKSV
jgi:hypothetical protein